MHKSIPSHFLQEIIETITLANTFTEFREVFLKKLHKICPYNFAVFDLYKFRSKESLLISPVIQSDFDAEFERKFLREYDTLYGRHSYCRWLHKEKKSSVYRHTDIITEKLRKESFYYNNYILRNGFDYALNCEFAYNEQPFAGLFLYRNFGLDNFSQEEMAYIKLLIPCILSSFLNTEDIESTNISTAIENQFSFSKREMDIISLLYKGFSNKEIAKTLNVSELTIKKHVSNIYQKTNLHSRNKLISMLYSLGYTVYS